MPYPTARRTVPILGIAIDNVSQSEAIERLMEMAAERRPHHVVTVNPEFVVRAQHDEAFQAVLAAADLALPDGVGLMHAARFLGTPLKGRATGVDTVRGLAAKAAQCGYSFYLLGAAPGVAEAAAARLAAENPGLRIAGTYAGAPSPEEEDEIVARIRQARPDFVFVAFGAPQQDLWIARNLDRLEVPVAAGVGGTLDFVSGHIPRAPAWMRSVGLEWLYRLIRQPWRWRRMLALPHFALLVVGSRLRGRSS